MNIQYSVIYILIFPDDTIKIMRTYADVEVIEGKSKEYYRSPSGNLHLNRKNQITQTPDDEIFCEDLEDMGKLMFP